MTVSISRLLATLVTGAALALPSFAQAQSGKYIRLIVPYAPGGGTDILGRHFAKALGEELNTQVIVENRAGANGNIGASAVVKSDPNGETLLLGDLALAVNPSLVKAMPFDPVRDLEPVAMVGKAPLVLVVNPALNADSVSGLVKLAKAEPGKLTFATAGLGNPPHVAGELFKMTTGTEIASVQYKGVGPALNDLLGGHVSMMFTGISSTKQYIDGGRIKALAVTGARRAPTLPAIPTITEAGYPQADVTSWWAVFVPAKVSAETVARLQRATEKALQDPALQEQLARQNIEPTYADAKTLGKHLEDETRKWAAVIKNAKITAE